MLRNPSSPLKYFLEWDTGGYRTLFDLSQGDNYEAHRLKWIIPYINVIRGRPVYGHEPLTTIGILLFLKEEEREGGASISKDKKR